MKLKKIINPDLPEKPGVYLFKRDNQILYIGKAKNLKKRVDQYFKDRGHGLVKNLVGQADDIEYIITDDEKDALLLEYNLIHHHQPPFNIRLKDDKSYPLIEITTTNEYPGIYFKRNAEKKNFYLGPIVDSRKTKNLIDTITRLFKIRTCNDSTFNRHTPCLYYYIERCSAPCSGNISRESYLNQVNDAVDFLKGNKSKITTDLQTRMNLLSENLEFEQAQKVKEDIELIQRFVLESYISSARKTECDIIALHHKPEKTDSFIILFSVLEGRIRRKEFLNFESVSTIKEEILKEFLISFYETENIPREIVLQFFPIDKEHLENVFSQLTGHQVTIKLPFKGIKKKIMDLAVMNLNLYINKSDYKSIGEGLRNELDLNRFPYCIEGVDISHFSERERVGAVVVFENGIPIKKKYRNYIIKDAPPGDTEAIKEVLERRFKDLPPEEHPDLLLIDGGKGQLSAAMAIKKKFNLICDIISLAKEEERIFVESGASVVFVENSPQRFLLQNVRDEVHRRAVSFHRKRRSILPS